MRPHALCGTSVSLAWEGEVSQRRIFGILLLMITEYTRSSLIFAFRHNVTKKECLCWARRRFKRKRLAVRWFREKRSKNIWSGQLLIP